MKIKITMMIAINAVVLSLLISVVGSRVFGEDIEIDPRTVPPLIKMQPKKATSQKSRLFVRTIPPMADLYLETKLMGKTPLELELSKDSKAKLIARKQGFQDSTVEVSPTKDVDELIIRLKK